MKKIYVLFFVSVLLASCSNNTKTINANYFQGNITYKFNYEVKNSLEDSAKLSQMVGKTSNCYFKAGNYFQTYEGAFITEELYNVADNKLYVKYRGSDTLKWASCAEPGKEMLSYEINKQKDTILGIVCDEYITHYAFKTVTFYFNADTLKINPDWYKQFTLTNKNINAARMGAMFLKYKMEYKNFSMTAIATSINQHPVKDSMFTIKPTDMVIKDPHYK